MMEGVNDMTNRISSMFMLVVASACSSSHGSADGGCESTQPAVHLYEDACPAGSMGPAGCLIDHIPTDFF
jgi:hypothetical protein